MPAPDVHAPIIRWPWVSRRALEQAIARATAAEAHVAEMRIVLAREAERTDRAIAEYRALTTAAQVESRSALRDALEMAKTAAASLFGVVTDVESGTSSSVRENDRAIAAKRRDEANRR